MFRRIYHRGRALAGVAAMLALLALLGWLLHGGDSARASLNAFDSAGPQPAGPGQVKVGQDYHHDTSVPLRDMPQIPVGPGTSRHEAPENPHLNISARKDMADAVVQSKMGPLAMPAP